jgi:hypothetical protein
MRKFLIFTCIGMSFVPPVLALESVSHPEVKKHTVGALGCAVLLECKNNIERVTVDYNFGPQQTEYLEEIKRIVKSFDSLSVEFYIADEFYFPHNTNGIYKPGLNRLIIRKDLLDDKNEFIKTLRHEGWHVVQDAMAGGVNNAFIAQVHQDHEIPETLKLRTQLVYGAAGQTAGMSWEIDANIAELHPNKTAKYLEMAIVAPLWTQVEPTPLTKDWLVGCGYMPPQGKYKLYKNQSECKSKE